MEWSALQWQLVKYAFIKDNQQIYRNQSELLVKTAHSETCERYGIERLYAHLSQQGHNISIYMVRRIEEEHGLRHQMLSSQTL